jgi:hypothetical protein
VGPMDLAYHIQIFLHDLTRRVTDEAEVAIIAFLACAVLLYKIVGRGKRALT